MADLKNINKKLIYADISLILVALIRGSSFVAIKDILNNLNSFYIMTLRFGISSILLSLIFYKKLKNITLKDIKAGFIVGTFLFLAFTCQTIGLKFTTAGKQAFLTTLYVIIIPFLLYIKNKEHLDKFSLFSAILSLIGVGFLTINDNLKLSLNFGDKLTLICSFLFAAHIISIYHFIKFIDAILLSILQMLFTGLMSLICSLIFEPRFTNVNNESLISITYLIVICTMMNFIIQNIAQKYTHADHVGIILCLESVFGAILSVIFLNDTFNIKMILGCVIIFNSIIISETKLNFLYKYKRLFLVNYLNKLIKRRE